MSVGTSSEITLPRENLRARTFASFSPIEPGLIATPPIVNSTNVSTYLSKYVNPYPEFTFEKIAEVDFGPENCIARTTGFPANHPDFIYDYYFISLMRCIDTVVKPEYKGQINVDYDTPTPSS